jgi:hypothetical protein
VANNATTLIFGDARPKSRAGCETWNCRPRRIQRFPKAADKPFKPGPTSPSPCGIQSIPPTKLWRNLYWPTWKRCRRPLTCHGVSKPNSSKCSPAHGPQRHQWWRGPAAIQKWSADCKAKTEVLAAGRARGQAAKAILPVSRSVWARRPASRVRWRRAAPALDSVR